VAGRDAEKRTKMNRVDLRVIRSSGNIFTDFPLPDVDESGFNVRLEVAINRLITAGNLT
jgi:hypothetical protein